MGDAEVLRSLQAANADLHWPRWEEGAEPLTWPGVVAKEGRVAELHLAHGVVEVPAEIGQLTELTLLELSECEKLTQLPDEIFQLPALTSLDLSHCRELTALSIKVGQRTALTSLILAWCVKLTRLPAEIGKLTSLISLELSNCLELSELPAGIGQLTALRFLHLIACCQLTRLPSQIGHLTELRSLLLQRCDRLGALPEEIGELTKLTFLRLAGCSKLKLLPFEIEKLRALTSLDLSSCSNLTKLPDVIGRLTALASLNLSDCSELTELPAEICQLAKLTSLHLSRCRELIALPPRMDKLKALTSLFLTKCSKLAALPAEIGQLTALTELDISSCDELMALPADVGHLPALIKFNLTWCRQLRILPTEMSQLTKLTWLNLSYCHELKALPPAVGQLTALRVLHLSHCLELTKLPAKIGELTSLTFFDLSECFKLKLLPAEIGQLTSLTSLDISHCYVLTALPPEIGQLTALTKLDFDNCPNLGFPPECMHGMEAKELVPILASVLRLLVGDASARQEATKDTITAFLDGFVQIDAFAERLVEAVASDPGLPHLRHPVKPETAVSLASPACRRAMQQGLHLLRRFEVDDGAPLHFSATAAVLAATDHQNEIRRALKVMRELEHVRAELNGRLGLDANFVVTVVAVYLDASVPDQAVKTLHDIIAHPSSLLRWNEPSKGLSSHVDEILKGRSTSPDKDLACGPEGSDAWHGQYKFLLVLELADGSMDTALRHDRSAAYDWPLVREMSTHLAKALSHLHRHQRIHADFKPPNIVRIPQNNDFSWQLIDLDASCRIGQGFGTKVPSSGYCPPEMARVLLEATDPTTSALDASKLSLYTADKAYDLWSFGVVLFHLGSGKSLWHMYRDDSISALDLRRLANWTKRDLKTRLRDLNGERPTEAALCDLLLKLLDPCPKQRVNHFAPSPDMLEMEGVLEHIFFKPQRLTEDILQELPLYPLLGRFEVDDGPPLHLSATAVVLAATDHSNGMRTRCALKAMSEVEPVYAELTGRAELAAEFVVAILSLYVDDSVPSNEVKELRDLIDAKSSIEWTNPLNGLSTKIDKMLSARREQPHANLQESSTSLDKGLAGGPEGVEGIAVSAAVDTSGAATRSDARHSQYKFLLVLELADGSLDTALKHDITADDWPLVCKVGTQLAKALSHLHLHERIHADFKPANIVRIAQDTDFSWRLIDLDVSCKIGQGFGKKVPSSGYCPPEMATVLLEATDPSTGALDASKLGSYKADKAYDLWSFGVVLFHLGTGRSLWHMSEDDSISALDMQRLANWTESDLRMRLLDFKCELLRESKLPTEAAVLCDLLSKLLDPRAPQRVGHFERMEMVLEHAFFNPANLYRDDILNAILAKVDEIQKGVLHLNEKLQPVLQLGQDHLYELRRTREVLLRAVFEATEVKTPTTFVILQAELPSEEEHTQMLELKLSDDGEAFKVSGELGDLVATANDRFQEGKKWLEWLRQLYTGASESNREDFFGAVKNAFHELVTAETMYLYLVDELTGEPVRDSKEIYPIKISTRSDIVPGLLLPLMQLSMRAMSLHNGVAGICRLFGVPVPDVPNDWRKDAQSSIELLKQETSVEAFGVVHRATLARDESSQTVRGLELRQLEDFFLTHDKEKTYAGLRRRGNDEGTAVWTRLEDPEDVKQAIKKRAKERQQENKRSHEFLQALVREPMAPPSGQGGAREQGTAIQVGDANVTPPGQMEGRRPHPSCMWCIS